MHSPVPNLAHFQLRNLLKFQENPLDLKRIVAFHFHRAVSFILTQKSEFVPSPWKHIHPCHPPDLQKSRWLCNLQACRTPSRGSLDPGCLWWCNTRSEKKSYLPATFFRSIPQQWFILAWSWHVCGSFIKCVYNRGLSPNFGCVKTALNSIEIILTTEAGRQRLRMVS